MSGEATVAAAAEVAPSLEESACPPPANSRLVALHRAVRAAIVIPATFAITLLVIRDLQLATFAVFGCFALLVLADFGGLRRARAAAYVAAALGGAVLVALGTAVSPNAAVAAAVMLVLGFAVSFSGVFGGYVAAAQTALLLAFVLAVSIPETMLRRSSRRRPAARSRPSAVNTATRPCGPLVPPDTTARSWSWSLRSSRSSTFWRGRSTSNGRTFVRAPRRGVTLRLPSPPLCAPARRCSRAVRHRTLGPSKAHGARTVRRAFWVVLGTLSVLRSNALGTGRTTVQAIAGSVIGFVAGGLFASVAGKSPVLMWIALPVALFLASYAASAFGFIAGQAAFTVTVILIFNLIAGRRPARRRRR